MSPKLRNLFQRGKTAKERRKMEERKEQERERMESFYQSVHTRSEERMTSDSSSEYSWLYDSQSHTDPTHWNIQGQDTQGYITSRNTHNIISRSSSSGLDSTGTETEEEESYQEDNLHLSQSYQDLQSYPAPLTHTHHTQHHTL